MEAKEQIKQIILENNYFDTLAGERFREWNDIKDIAAVISFSGRSRNQKCYPLVLGSGSDSDTVYVTHLYVDRWGDVKVQLSPEDTDDINVILHPTNESIDAYDEEILQEWVKLLTF